MGLSGFLTCAAYIFRVTAEAHSWLPEVTNGSKSVWYPGVSGAAKTSSPVCIPAWPTWWNGSTKSVDCTPIKHFYNTLLLNTKADYKKNGTKIFRPITTSSFFFLPIQTAFLILLLCNELENCKYRIRHQRLVWEYWFFCFPISAQCWQW